MSYTNGLDKPSDYFRTKLYAGNATNNTAITWDETDTNMQADLLWFKSRTDTQTHGIWDSVRGAIKRLIPSSTAAEGDEAADLDSFDTNGFTVDAAANMNGSSMNIVTWGWKAGTSFTNDASSTSVGSIDSAGSVNTDAGFSIISHTGTGVGNTATIAHGLGVAPSMIIVKSRDSGDRGWIVYHKSLGAGKKLDLNDTTAAGTSDANWNGTEPTSSVFSVGTGGDTNTTDAFITYLFAEKKGYSKFGSYTGNGNADGPMIVTGFKPAFMMVKRAVGGTGSWAITDGKRDTFNAVDNYLSANNANAESDFDHADFLSNGIKFRTNNDGWNLSGDTYIYMAFAENPFVTSTGVPATAK